MGILFLCSTKQSVTVQKLDPNTRYEFVVRLHVDQMSSPWSSVVYHQTLPAGNKLSVQRHFTVNVFLSVSFWSFHCIFFTNVLRVVLCSVCLAPSQPPAGVRVTLIEEDTALVSWREPTESNVVITRYTILYASQKDWIAGHWQKVQREGK